MTFNSWITNVAPVGNTVTLKVPLPAESKESSYSLPEETRIEHNAASIDYRKVCATTEGDRFRGFERTAGLTRTVEPG